MKINSAIFRLNPRIFGFHRSVRSFTRLQICITKCMEAGLEAVEAKKEKQKKKKEFAPPGIRTRDHALGEHTR